ncbi:MAG TPA: DUF3313 domain-containing protein [Candidatus Binataceae bacterium]|nr:DUF3313 domain-containing protein [Candidatus Binataceae bacterium]
MNRRNALTRSLTGLTIALIATVGLWACSQTTGASPNVIQRVQGETPAAPPPNGFLGNDYSLLQPAAANPGQKAALAYINPNANFTAFNKILISPVTYWADSDSTLPADQQQELCDYFYNVLQKELGQNFTLTNEPGPGVARLDVALIDASSAVPVLRTISTIVPQARILSTIKYGLTGTYAFVGSATGAAKLTDSVSGQLLAAWEDVQFGTAAVKNAGVWQWGDAEHAMDYWANGLDEKLAAKGIQTTGPVPAQASGT